MADGYRKVLAEARIAHDLGDHDTTKMLLRIAGDLEYIARCDAEETGALCEELYPGDDFAAGGTDRDPAYLTEEQYADAKEAEQERQSRARSGAGWRPG